MLMKNHGISTRGAIEKSKKENMKTDSLYKIKTDPETSKDQTDVYFNNLLRVWKSSKKY